MALFLQPTLNATPETLRSLVMEYNWNDGFGLPKAVADHPNCDLAVALEMFWLADAISVYLGEVNERVSNSHWRAFCEILVERLLAGRYRKGACKFDVPLTKVQIYKYRKSGVPDLFITSFGAVGA